MRTRIAVLLSLVFLLQLIPSTSANAAKRQYNSYKGLVMAGYQGWFNAPDDGAGRGWYHYKGRDGFKPGSCTIDFWPEVSEYEKTYPTEFKMPDGTPARVMSSHDASTVDTHFRWMKEYGLDGVFMQRFVGEISNPSGRNHFNKVLANAMDAANKYERAICVMYDLSGMPKGGEKTVLNDIAEVAKRHNLFDHDKNPSYLYHNGKPLVTIWGVGFNDHRRYGLDEAQAIIDGLKKQGFSIMIGVPTHWRELKIDTESDPRLLEVIRQCDVVMPWFVGRYNESTYPHYAKLIKDDITWCNNNKVDYAPLCFPGFSWRNMPGHENSVQIPRNDGRFFWKQLQNAIGMGAEMIYVAMFDEIDEGTAIFKCAKEVPVGQSTFVPVGENVEPDHYLWLIGQARRMLNKEIPLQTEMPKRDSTSRLVYNHVFAPSEGLVNRLEKPYRRDICLNGKWQFQPVALPADYRQGAGKAPELPKPTPDGWSATPIKIPSPWNINDFANRNLEGPDHRNYPSYPAEWEKVLMGWLRRTIDIPADWAGTDIKLYFESVAGNAEVYVNGKKVGENFDLFLPFTVDITDVVKPGEKAELLVGVRSQKLFEDNSTVGRRIVPGGSMWGYLVNGIWQDVYLESLPNVAIENVYVKPLVNEGRLVFDVKVKNNTPKAAKVDLAADISEWLNMAGNDINSAPVPTWTLGSKVITTKAQKLTIKPGETVTATVEIPVADDQLKHWTPENPNLYAALFSLKEGKRQIDSKYERFGWRQWTIDGTDYCLNGKPYRLHGDSWHFMGVPQLTRRYPYAWYRAIKDMNGNAVRLHAQVYPRFYLDVADEMGICVLDETANWASDGGPKLDSPIFWENSRDHLSRMIIRDRNHPSVFGWSISNENKPVILHVFNRPDLMPQQKKAWQEWTDICRNLDVTRPWISSDGEDDGDGILPVTIGHYGNRNSMREWIKIGKPWGIGETSMAYYGTPEQIAAQNGERAYASQLGRMEGLANEVYGLIKDQRDNDASYSTVFNMVWYALQPLPLGKRDLTTVPSLTDDGIFFGEYVEGQPGVQPERVGPYCTTFNPGYDPSLPLYRPWPMFEAMRAANAPDGPAWYSLASVNKADYEAPKPVEPESWYKQVAFIGDPDGAARRIFDGQGVNFSDKITDPANSIYIIDGTKSLTDDEVNTIRRHTAQGADVWIWGLTADNLQPHHPFYGLLPLPATVTMLDRSSFIPAQKSWTRGLNLSDFYFCEVQNTDICRYVLTGELVNQGEVLLDACRTNWRAWNKRAEELKTAAVLRSENECPANTAVFVRYKNGPSTYYVSTLGDFTGSEKGYNTMATMLHNAGIRCTKQDVNTDEMFFLRDRRLMFPTATGAHIDNGTMVMYVYSPRPLDDLLIEPNMPKLSVFCKGRPSAVAVNGTPMAKLERRGEFTECRELPLQQGWNKITITLPAQRKGKVEGYFACENRDDFLPLVKATFTDPTSGK